MKYLLGMLMLLFFCSCENPIFKDYSETIDKDLSFSYGADQMDDDMEEIEMDIPSTQQIPLKIPQLLVKKAIKTGNIGFQSKDAEKDYQKIKQFLSGYGAFIEKENQTKSDYSITYSLTIRVETEYYDSLYETLGTISEKVDEKTSQIEDVTKRYYDLNTRIKNKKALEARYIDILSKAKEIRDILEVEEKLNQVLTDIERMQGQFNLLSNQIRYSTIQLNMYEVLPYSYSSNKRPGFWARITSSLDDGWQIFLSFMVGLVSLWPFLIVIIGGIAGFRYIRKKRKLKSIP